MDKKLLLLFFLLLFILSPMRINALTYNVTVPSGTNECYISGSFNGWSVSANPMTKVDDTHYTVEIVNAVVTDGYEYLCGPAWAYEQANASGTATSQSSWSANDVVVNWKFFYTTTPTIKVKVPTYISSCYIVTSLDSWTFKPASECALTLFSSNESEKVFTITLTGISDPTALRYRFSASPDWTNEQTNPSTEFAWAHGTVNTVNTFAGIATAPTISSFTPTSSGNGTSVVITGTGFTGATIVSFGGTAASTFTIDSDTQITAVVGSGTTGSVNVTTSAGTGIKTGFIWLEVPKNISGTQNSSDLSLTSGSIVNVLNGGELTINSTTDVNSITVNQGGKLTLNSGSTLSTGKIYLQSNSSGTATFVDKNPGTSIISGNVQQYLSQGRNWYVSSPISAATAANLNTGTSVVSYNESTGAWIPETGDLTPGRGYISVSSTGTGTNNILFDGILNTGDVLVSLTRLGSTKAGFNLVGNPYPSYLDFSKIDTTGANIIPTIWYRTKTTPVDGVSNYTFDTYNVKSNIGTTLGATLITNLIPPLQAFWVRVKSDQTSGILTFTNAMRAHTDYMANMLKVPTMKVQSQQLLRLEVSNGVNRDQAIVYFNDDASNGYDTYDSPKMINGNAATPEIYTCINGEKLVINGMQSPTNDIEIPLGFTTGEANTFSIRATELTNLSNVDIILKDKVLNTELLLKDGNIYTYTSDATSTDSRFAVLFKAKSVSTDLEAVSNSIDVIIHSKNGYLTIENKDKSENNLQVTIFNSVGQQMKSFNMSGTQTVNAFKVFSSGINLVKIQSKNKIVTRKVIVE